MLGEQGFPVRDCKAGCDKWSSSKATASISGKYFQEVIARKLRENQRIMKLISGDKREPKEKVFRTDIPRSSGSHSGGQFHKGNMKARTSMVPG